MKVKAISSQLTAEQIVALNASERFNPKYAVTPGHEYVVLGIWVPQLSKFYGRTILYRLVGDDGQCLLHPAALFEITDPRVSKHWVAQHKESSFGLQPPEFLADEYFFDDLSERKQEVVAVFSKVRQKLEDEFETLELGQVGTHREALTALLQFRYPVSKLLDLMSRFSDDYQGAPIIVSSDHLVHAIKRFLEGEASAQELESWANLVENRPGLELESGKEDRLSDVLAQLSTPGVWGAIAADRCRALLRSLSVVSSS